MQDLAGLDAGMTSFCATEAYCRGLHTENSFTGTVGNARFRLLGWMPLLHHSNHCLYQRCVALDLTLTSQEQTG